MSRFSLVSYEEASDGVKKIYDESMAELGIPFVLNWLKCQGSNEELLRGNWEKLKSVMLRGEVPGILKQVIIYNISKEKKCEYCAKAHGIFADGMSSQLSDKSGFRVTENLSSDIIPESYKLALDTVTRAAINPKQILDADFEALRGQGFDDSEIHELFALADLTNMLNTIAEISDIKVDNELLEPMI